MHRTDQTFDSWREGRHEEEVCHWFSLRDHHALSLLEFRIQERIVARRKEQQVADDQKAIEMEKKRIVDGKSLLELKQK